MKIIDMLHKETGLPLDYLIQEQAMSKEIDSGSKVDCKHFIHWDMMTVSYSYCNHYNKRFIDGNITCKACEYYESRFAE